MENSDFKSRKVGTVGSDPFAEFCCSTRYFHFQEEQIRLPGNAWKLLWCLVTICELLHFAVCFGCYMLVLPCDIMWEYFHVTFCEVENFQDKGQAGKNKCAVDITAAIASAGIAASLITISALALNCGKNHGKSDGLQMAGSVGSVGNTFHRSHQVTQNRVCWRRPQRLDS